MMVKGYYALPENTADVVFVGSSGVYRYWQPAFAFKESGIASTSWATSFMPGFCAKDITKEVLKTQHPKTLVVCTSMFCQVSENLENRIYFVSMNMKNSENKYRALNRFCESLELSFADRIPYYIPFLQFHSTWSSLNEGSFRETMPSYLNSCYQTEFLEKQSRNKTHSVTDQTEPIDPYLEASLRDFLEYCKGLDMDILFYGSPLWNNEDRIKNSNYVHSIIREYGFDVLDFNDPELYDRLQLDVTTDIMDSTHTNIKGSHKFTHTMSSILKERYDLPDRRSDPDYSDWITKADQYYVITEPYMQTESQ